jgi:hypothetical protein
VTVIFTLERQRRLERRIDHLSQRLLSPSRSDAAKSYDRAELFALRAAIREISVLRRRVEILEGRIFTGRIEASR